MVAIVIIAGVAAFYFWMNGVGNNYTTDPTKIATDPRALEPPVRAWRTYEVVGITPDGIEVVVEGFYVTTQEHYERVSESIDDPALDGAVLTVWNRVLIPETTVDPSPDKWQFRASQIVGGVVSPFAGQNTINSFGWGVPYQEALESATWRLESSYAGGGDIDPLPAPQGPSTGADLDVDGFPQQGMDSFTGMPTDLSNTVDLSGSTSTSDISLTDLEVI